MPVFSFFFLKKSGVLLSYSPLSIYTTYKNFVNIKWKFPPLFYTLWIFPKCQVIQSRNVGQDSLKLSSFFRQKSKMAALHGKQRVKIKNTSSISTFSKVLSLMIGSEVTQKNNLLSLIPAFTRCSVFPLLITRPNILWFLILKFIDKAMYWLCFLSDYLDQFFFCPCNTEHSSQNP